MTVRTAVAANVAPPAATHLSCARSTASPRRHRPTRLAADRTTATRIAAYADSSNSEPGNPAIPIGLS